MLKVRSLSKWFAGRRVLDRVDLDVGAGERVVVVGENGCGKSTLLQIVAGVLDAYEGKMTLPATIGYAPEKPDMPDHLLVCEWLDIVSSVARKDVRVSSDIAALAGRKIGALSLGQRQRVSLAAAFMIDADLLVLDEPTNALDDGARGALASALGDKTALIATHDRDFAERVATRIIALSPRHASKSA